MIQCYFGDGKGKTTAAIGATIRFVGCGNRVLFVQFLKNSDSSEIEVLKKLDQIDLLFSKERYALYDNINKERTDILFCAYNKLLFEDVKNRQDTYHMIVLDEILDAVEFGYIDENEFINLLNEWKESKEIILTGHELSENIAKVCDYISEVREISHPYNSGTTARKGIEY